MEFACLAIPVVIAVAVLVDWEVGNKRSVAIVPGMTAMNPLTAGCVLLLTTTTLAWSPLRATGLRRAWTLGVALVIGGCGIVVPRSPIGSRRTRLSTS